jgi:hypothetical protein
VRISGGWIKDKVIERQLTEENRMHLCHLSSEERIKQRKHNCPLKIGFSIIKCSSHPYDSEY